LLSCEESAVSLIDVMSPAPPEISPVFPRFKWRNSTMGTNHAFRRSVVVLCLLLLGATSAYAQLTLNVTANPNPVRPGETVDVEVTVTNSGASPRSNLTLEVVIPSGVATYSELLNTGGGDCPSVISGSTSCSPTEVVTWTIGTLAPGAGVTVSMPPTVLSGGSAPPDGTTLAFDARVLESAVEVATATANAEVQSAPVAYTHLTLPTNREV